MVMLYQKYFQFQVSKEEDTDLQIVSVTDLRTGFVVRTAINQTGKQTPSIMAFAGARYSRSSDSTEEIFREIKASGKNAQEKLASIFRNYGHASVADMAQIFGYIENIPQIYAAKFFYETAIGGGQERSTRYQDFSDSSVKELEEFLPPETRGSITQEEEYLILNETFKKLQQKSLQNYGQWVEKLTPIFTDFYKVDTADKKQVGALKSRVFDTARYFLLNGINNCTSLGWITAAREWARIISQLKSSSEWKLVALGEQLEVLFAPEKDFAASVGYLPEAPDLIRYTTADEVTANNLTNLKEYLETQTNLLVESKQKEIFEFKPILVDYAAEEYTSSEKSAAQYISTLYPKIEEKWLLGWVKNLSIEKQKQLSEILFRGFNHHQQMGVQARTNSKTFILSCSFAEARDLNRHRAWGRFSPYLSSEVDFSQFLYDGYTLPLYLSDNPELSSERLRFETALQDYYVAMARFAEDTKRVNWFPKEVLTQMLPFAQVVKYWLHGSTKEISYLTKLRVRPGGHINYRVLAYEMAQIAAENDPLLSSLSMENKPDATSRTEFLDRS